MNYQVVCYLSLLYFVDGCYGAYPSDGRLQSGSSRSKDVVLSRKRRYVVFPEGSTFNMAFCMSLKALTGPDLIFTEGVAWAMSYDLPNETRYEKENRENMMNRHRRGLYKRMELLMENAGLDGRNCVLQSICETSRNILPRQGIIEEVLRLLFSFSGESKIPSTGFDDVYHLAHEKGNLRHDCQSIFPCPVNMFHLGLNFAQSIHPT